MLVCDGQRHHLDTGDCVTFDADLPHHFENPGGRALLGVPRRACAGLSRRQSKEQRAEMPKTMFEKIWNAHELDDGRGCSTSTCTSCTR